MATDTALQVAIDIAEGMKPLHSSGFLINDLKCDNILLQQVNNSTRAKNYRLRTRFPPKSVTSSIHIVRGREEEVHPRRTISPRRTGGGFGRRRTNSSQRHIPSGTNPEEDGPPAKRRRHLRPGIEVRCHEDPTMRPSLDEVITTLRGGGGGSWQAGSHIKRRSGGGRGYKGAKHESAEHN